MVAEVIEDVAMPPWQRVDIPKRAASPCLLTN